jgi:hypothetical protein
MSIMPSLLDDLDPDTKRVLGVALEKTRVSLGLADDFADGIIAKRLVELAKAGECNPDLLCQGAVAQLCGRTDRESVQAPRPTVLRRDGPGLVRLGSARPTYELLCIHKSSKQTGNLPGGMWQAGNTARQCGSG